MVVGRSRSSHACCNAAASGLASPSACKWLPPPSPRTRPRLLRLGQRRLDGQRHLEHLAPGRGGRFEVWKGGGNLQNKVVRMVLAPATCRRAAAAGRAPPHVLGHEKFEGQVLSCHVSQPCLAHRLQQARWVAKAHRDAAGGAANRVWVVLCTGGARGGRQAAGSIWVRSGAWPDATQPQLAGLERAATQPQRAPPHHLLPPATAPPRLTRRQRAGGVEEGHLFLHIPHRRREPPPRLQHAHKLGQGGLVVGHEPAAARNEGSGSVWSKGQNPTARRQAGWPLPACFAAPRLPPAAAPTARQRPRCRRT